MPYANGVSSGEQSCLTPPASIATRATFRDDREASLMAARAERNVVPIYVIVKHQF